MGKIFDDSGLECVDPPQTTPTPRPIPTMKAAVKSVTSGMTKTASTLLIIFVTITLVIFGVLRIFDHGRCALFCEFVHGMDRQTNTTIGLN